MRWKLGLPKKKGSYIVTTKWGGVSDWHYDPNAFHNAFDSAEFWQENIVAYCEFPKAYKGSDNEDESR